VKYSSLSSEDLVQVCVDVSDSAAWEEFVQRFSPLIFRIVQRTLNRSHLASPDIVDDQVQSVFLKLCGKRVLQSFKRQGNIPVEAFLTTVTVHHVIDYIKSQTAGRRGAGKASISIDSEDAPQLPQIGEGSVAEVEKALLLREIENILQSSLSGPNRERDFEVFRLYYQVGLTAPEIAGLPAMNLGLKGVESTIVRLNSLIRKGMFKS
jgi:RNA polymerase sigma factor (sigma-70 family)